MEVLLNFDMKVFEFVERYVWHPVLDPVMAAITHLGDIGLIWILIAVALLLFKKTRRYGAAMGLALLLSLLVNDMIIKVLVARPRPFVEALPDGWGQRLRFPSIVPRPHDFSFPSGHTSSSFAAATVLLLSVKKRFGISAFALAVLIGFLRIYLHVHYCTDVLAGVAVGIVLGLTAKWLVDKIVSAFSRRRKTGHRKKQKK